MRNLLITATLGTFIFFLLLLSMTLPSWAHCVVGKRFFPSTIAIDDPCMSDELSFFFDYLKSQNEYDYSIPIGYSKRILPHFGIEIGDAYQFVKPSGEKTQHGFSNLGVGLKYQFLTRSSYETVFSAAVDVDIGHTGNSSVDADNFTTITPTFDFGHGFGDLPDSMKYLRPFAITGVIGPSIPTSGDSPDTMNYGFTLQYNLQYLQSYVKYVGLPVPINRMIMLVEFPFETDLNRGSGGQTTGYVDPGIIWFGKYISLGAEAQIPINDASGSGVGVLAIVNIFIDDLFPHSIGAPIFH
jgi:hypothetical protein